MTIRKGSTEQQGTPGPSRPVQGAPGGFATEGPKPVIVGEAKPEWPPTAALQFDPEPEVEEPETGEEGEDGEGGRDGEV